MDFPKALELLKQGKIDVYTAPNCDILANDWEVFEQNIIERTLYITIGPVAQSVRAADS